MSLLFGVAVRKPQQASIKDLVSAGLNNSFRIKDGQVWVWGMGGSKNGVGNYVQIQIPVTIAGVKKTFCRISAATTHTLAIDKNGRAWAWGDSNQGQLGLGAITSATTPMSVLGLVRTFCNISASLGNHSIALDKNGRLWAWGDNSNGRLGINSIISQRTPVSVLGAVKTFCKITTGNAWSAAIDKYGRVWCWGNGGDGRLANGSTVSSLTPRSIIGQNKTFCEIGAGNATTAAIDKYGLIWSWGFNNSGQLGNAANTPQCTPVSLAGTRKTFCKISLSNGQTIALDKNGGIWGWGFNVNALLGDNSVTARNTPVSLAGAKKTFCVIAAGNQHSLAIDKYGNTWAWGPNSNGQLGANVPVSVRTPKCIVLGRNKTFCDINLGQAFSIAVDVYGRLWSWGSNTNGRLGDNSTNTRYTPVSVAGGIKTFCSIGVGLNHSMAISSAGRIWAWGNNIYGMLGDNSVTSRLTPVSVRGAIKTFCKIAAGETHSVAIDKNGRVWSWGDNSYGQLGDTTIISKLTPVSVRGAIKTFCKIAASTWFTAAIDKNGRGWAWGINEFGQLGDGSFVFSRATPVSVAGVAKTFCDITCGADFVIALDKNGRLWGWGYNYVGQLGNGISGIEGDFQNTPVSVAGAVKTFCKIKAGNASALAIDKYGIVWAWGRNNNGVLGNNSITSRNTPVSLAGAKKTFCVIHMSTGSYSAAGIDKYGKIWAWGHNDSGQLPIQPENAVILTPIRVCTI